MSETHTMKNLNYIKDFYSVTEDVLKSQSTVILDKMLKAAHAEDTEKLHNLGYYIFAAKAMG